MSLINDALKKAQKQRTGEAPPLASMPSVGGESPQRIAKRAKPADAETLLVRAGIGLAVVLVLAVGGFFLFRGKPQSDVGSPLAGAPSSPSSVQAPSSPLQAPSSAVPGPAAQQPATSNEQPAVTAPTFTLPVAPKSEDRNQRADVSSVNAGGASRPDNPPASSPVAQAPVQPPATTPKTSGSQPSAPSSQLVPPAPAPKLEPHAIEYIENIKVAGIRASATDAKVLMNDRVYRIGSMVSADFGLKLVEITASSLTFEDDRGGRYTRTF